MKTRHGGAHRYHQHSEGKGRRSVVQDQHTLHREFETNLWLHETGSQKNQDTQLESEEQSERGIEEGRDRGICDQRTMQLFKQLPTPCFTYQLYSYHKNCFKRKCSITQVKQIFQTRSQQFQHHSIVFTTWAKIVNLRYTIQGKRKSYLIISSS